MDYPQFVEDQCYIALDKDKSENDQLKAMLSNLTRVHLLSANKFDCFDDLIREYIVSGIEIFGLETGIVSHIVGSKYRVCDVVSPLDVLEKGQEFDLQDTYCKAVYDKRRVVGMPRVGELPYMQTHPIYQNLKLEAYISAPIFIENELFGTLNFTSTHARGHGFSKHEQYLIMLLANSIGAYLQLRQKEENLKTLNNQIKKFVGYVAHDLRNPIGSILTLSTLARRAQNDSERQSRIIDKIGAASSSALELVTTILESAALGSGKIELKKEEICLGQLAQSAIDSVNEFAQETKHQIIADTRLQSTAFLDKDRISQVLNNLLINAIKYSVLGSEIQLLIEPRNNETAFRIVNKVASDNRSASNNHQFSSIGFGIEIVRDILNAHHSELIIKSSVDLYEAEFSISNVKD